MSKTREIGMMLDNDDNGNDKGAKKRKAAARRKVFFAEAGVEGDKRKNGSTKHRAERNVAREQHA